MGSKVEMGRKMKGEIEEYYVNVIFIYCRWCSCFFRYKRFKCCNIFFLIIIYKSLLIGIFLELVGIKILVRKFFLGVLNFIVVLFVSICVSRFFLLSLLFFCLF